MTSTPSTYPTLRKLYAMTESNHAFVKGWSRLPVKLRQEIIKYTVNDEDPVTHPRPQETINTRILLFLSCPGLAEFIIKAFYIANTFAIYAGKPKVIFTGIEHYTRISSLKYRHYIFSLRIFAPIEPKVWLLDPYRRRPGDQNLKQMVNLTIDVKRLVIGYGSVVTHYYLYPDFEIGADKMGNLVMSAISVKDKKGITTTLTTTRRYFDLKVVREKKLLVGEKSLKELSVRGGALRYTTKIHSR
ncbi:hypothetical protein K458DRAFT_387143 [Lentithecium fluviatile CBS 122367]|uniref:Uncharacterized protein n=1 Tax=Lentithecium fluviatile CBS 122367 TaxID=1168545 RepID=A0A6G1J6J0_9PLEO|nr:hypothetical protein K458DRAFT_387143 [Lentithecium fluviatile CBS 122367]